MPYDPESHHRRSIRLKGYDYSQAGAYFVTICTQNRERLFREIVDGETQLNGAGKMVERWWCELRNKFTNIELDRYVVMPNHFHGIIIVGADPCVCPSTGEHVGADLGVCPSTGEHVGADLGVCPSTGEHTGSVGGHTGPPLQKIVQWFKTMATNEYIRGIRQKMYAPINKRLWQRNYYEHVVRNEDELNCVREYILYNPLQWQFDRENPGWVENKAYDDQWRYLEGVICGKT